MTDLNEKIEVFVTAVHRVFNESKTTITRNEIQKVVDETGIKFPHWLTTLSTFKVERGVYQVPSIEPSSEIAMTTNFLRQPKIIDEFDAVVPEKLPGYVKFGYYNKLKDIVNSRQFFPVFLTGLSGAGKTQAVTQICAELKREMVRFNMSIESDEGDLLGNYSLIDGNTVYVDGPVLNAMKRGAVLLIDEIDRASNKIMCLQAIMEGQGFLNKKTGEYVHPAPGFNIIATANTRGFGSEEGRYLAQVMDSAFLERFYVTMEWDLADIKTEKKILGNLIDDVTFVNDLAKWSDIVKQSFKNGAIDEYISTRRLVHIAKTYSIFKDKLLAIELCVARYDQETRTALFDLFTKVSSEVESGPENDGVDITDEEVLS